MNVRQLLRSPILREAFAACRPHFLAVAGLSLLLNLLFLAPAIYMLQVYDRVVTTGGKTTLLYITIALALALITLALLDALRSRILLRAGARINNVLAPQILRRMTSSERPLVGAEAVRDLDNLRQVVGSPVAAAIFDAPWTPVFIIVSFMLHFWLGIFAMVSTALLVALAVRNERATRPLTDGATRSLAASYAAQQIVAARGGTARALGMSDALVARHSAERSRALGSLLSAQFTGGRYSAAIRFFRLFAQSAALGIGALLAIDGQISSGAIIAASILLGRALQPVDTIVSGWSSFSSALTSSDKLSELFPEGPHREEARTALPSPRGRLEVQKVVVNAPGGGRPILAGVSLRVEPGQIVGIVGPSGSGKTTLARVISGVLVPDEGTVRIDGAPFHAWNDAELGRHIGYMSQEPSLFDGTVKENISRFSRWRGADPAEVDGKTVAAAMVAEIHELIMNLPQGYETHLSGFASGLSAGQAQRVALARALYDNPAVLILDEPNAFMDAQGEAALMKAMERARERGATVIVIAHRLAILRSADALLVMNNGLLQNAAPRRDVTPAAGAFKPMDATA